MSTATDQLDPREPESPAADAPEPGAPEPGADLPPASASQAERLAAARERYAPLFAWIAEGAIQRDATRELPRRQIRALTDAGFGAVRLPLESGGGGLDLPSFFDLVVDLAAADPNVAQALRGHFAFVEDHLGSRPGPLRDAWLSRIVAGDIAGNAWTEVGAVALGGVDTTVSEDESGAWTVSGTKYYSTGSIFADWLDVFARRPDTQEDVIAYVAANQPGVTRTDDWTGFGQRTTGSGTTVLDAAVVAREHIVPVPQRFRYQTALYQQVLLATLAGIARGAADQVAQALLHRTRGYSHGTGEATNRDPQLLQVVGEVDATAEAARAVVAQVSDALQSAADTGAARWASRRTGSAEAAGPRHAAAEADRAADDVANRQAELASARGQVVLSRLVPQAVTQLFDALGASATDEALALDRHWRSARTVVSHNPWVYKARILGEAAVHGSTPDPLWGVGDRRTARGA